MKQGIFINWLLFILLACIWGSSFILMKEGMVSLSPIEVASLRIVTAGLVLLPLAIKGFRKISGKNFGLVFLSGLLGSLLPAYLFCFAETLVDSALAGTLNSLTPVFAILSGIYFFKQKVSKWKVVGVVIAFVGSVLLLGKPGFGETSQIVFALLIVLATMMYGVNVNLVHRYLHHCNAIDIVSVAMVLCALPAFFVLGSSGFFERNFDPSLFYSISAAVVLGTLGTALASILFYILIKRSGIVFSSMVTYLIPFVANGWGLWLGEQVGWLDIICLIVILAGVYLVNRREPEDIVSLGVREI